MSILKFPGVRYGIVLASLAIFAMAGVACANPAPDPSAFVLTPVSGITVSPAQFVSGYDGPYRLTLSSDAFLLYGGVEYPIALIWGIYAVNMTGSDANDFIASGPDIGGWKWDQKPNTGNDLTVGGWLNSPKDEALHLPLSGSVFKDFTYDQFTYTGIAPVLGLHVSVTIPDGAVSPFGSGVTGNIIPTSVPEPSAIYALLVGVCGLGGSVLRMRRARS